MNWVVCYDMQQLKGNGCRRSTLFRRFHLCFLVARGMDEHEARHAILNVLSEEVWHVLREERPFDVERCKRELKKLVR